MSVYVEGLLSYQTLNDHSQIQKEVVPVGLRLLQVNLVHEVHTPQAMLPWRVACNHVLENSATTRNPILEDSHIIHLPASTRTALGC
jgi:hypothetical protein